MTNPGDVSRPKPWRRWSRRGFMAAGATAVGSTLLPAGSEARAAYGDRRGFAMITDMHANVDAQARLQYLRDVMTHIAGRDPAAVLNCGDITDFGVDAEFALYRSAIPDAVWPVLHHVPGNHEEQWNADALEAYRRWFGPTRHSFDIDGTHFVGLDPLVSQEWSWHFSDYLIEWLETDLRRLHPDTPVVVFNHFPMAANWFYIKNSERFVDLLSRYPIRLMLSGHAHHLQVDRFNGATQLVGAAIKNAPVYYWFDRADGDALRITQVTLADDGTSSQEVVAVAPLASPGPGGELGPVKVHADATGGVLTLRVRTGAPAAAVSMQIYPQGGSPEPWHPLAAHDPAWTGGLPVDSLPPGRHRVTVRALDDDGAAFDQTVPFDLAGSGPEVAWTTNLDGRIQGDLAAHGDLVVAATVAGDVGAFTTTVRSAQPRWRRKIGSVYKGAAFSRDGDTVYVGSADHHLYALSSHTGEIHWRRDLEAPIECDLLVTRVDGADRVVAVSGTRLSMLTVDGRIAWAADLGGTFAGQPACDGRRVFAASSTSDALGFDARTGQQLWATRCTDVSDAYHQILNGPWAARIRLSPAGEVLIPTVTKVLKLDAATGAVLWTTTGIQGGAYTPPTVTDEGLLVFEGGKGTAVLLDFATGDRLWVDHTLPRSRSAGPIRTSTSTRLLMATNTGALVRIDVAARTIESLLQMSRAFSLSTGVVVDAGGSPVLVAGDKDGMLRGVVDVT